MDVLIPETRLIVDDALLGRIEGIVPAVNWPELDDDVRQAYARYIALLDDRLRLELGVGVLSEQVVFYNAYYWVLLYAMRFQARHGFDAGVEQEVFKVLERAPANIDWQLVEQINQAARLTAGWQAPS